MNITDCVNITEAEIVYDLLLEFNPDLIIKGLPTVPTKGDDWALHEMETCRFLNLGERPVDLKSTLEVKNEKQKLPEESDISVKEDNDSAESYRTSNRNDRTESEKINV